MGKLIEKLVSCIVLDTTGIPVHDYLVENYVTQIPLDRPRTLRTAANLCLSPFYKYDSFPGRCNSNIKFNTDCPGQKKRL